MNILGKTINNKTPLYIVTLTEEEVTYLKDQPLLSASGVVLDYEHVSQNGPDANENRNDCGAACVTVCARSNGYEKLKVDTVAKTYMKPNKPMYVFEVQRALRGYGMGSVHEMSLTPNKVVANIVHIGKPVIALVDYQSLPKQFVKYDGSHYVVLYGVLPSGDFLYLDPLSDGLSELTMSEEQLTDALINVTKSGNKPNQGLLLT